MTAEVITTRLMKAGVATGVMLVAGWTLAPTLTDWQSRRLANRLVLRAASVDDNEVKIALRQLAGFGEFSIEPLMIAAASERESVASTARQIIDEQIAELESLAKSPLQEDEYQRFTITAISLATALANHVHDFGPAGKQWAEQLALSMIELTDVLPAGQTRQLLESCNQVLTAVPPRGPRLRTINASNVVADRSTASELPTPEPQLEPLTRASEGSLDVLARIQPRTPTRLTQEPNPLPVPRASNPSLAWAARKTDAAVVTIPETLGLANEANLQTTRQPIKTTKSQVVDIPTPQDMAAQAAALRLLSTDALFERLTSAPFYEAGIMRSVLNERGYSNAELALRQQLTSPNASDRLRYIDDVSELPAASARRLLRWLLGDEDAEVRLRALTALATAKSPDLRELARELAIRDDDPRVAELASRLLRQTR